MTAKEAGIPIIAKANAGVPQFIGAEIHYSGTPELMATTSTSRPTRARASSAAAAARRSVTCRRCTKRCHHHAGPRPDEAAVVAELGPLQAPGAKGGHRVGGEGRRNRRT